jgi:methionine-S-sulfoxide reductase
VAKSRKLHLANSSLPMTMAMETSRFVFLASLLLVAISTCEGFVTTRCQRRPYRFPPSHHHHRRDRSSALQAIREATFAMGCFWKPSEELLKVDGVVDTVVGYTGHPTATQVPPTYESVCFGGGCWVEGVRVQYDDEKLSYEQLLDAFFEAQEPKLYSRQYASIIFPHDATQKATAEKWLRDNQDRVRRDGVSAATTQIEAQSPFYRAENYHQRYWQKTRPRLAGIIALLAVSSGILDGVTPVDLQSAVHTGANALGLAGLIYVTAERTLDTKTVEL